ncbi:sigma-70 family RNA polymerase sigma factor [Actinoplanes sp. TRM 88003]|uniref:Sigma-70 family RNA polymerase sigma factor n=1 Tax=Paractinoplanes aksuensis TaxID=2939490 RepID=A0ABT1DTQ9_9ACTN|nr:sigma-70 family RNA polymerase sigma factor [Actinoplanes aksuensis]MCO8274208.1 sigma-70 family RNA polymerase sigma factor [Actinoplanes aksuensis]
MRAEAFQAHRERLLAIATRVLGNRADAEDVVQEAWLRLARQEPGTVDNLAGWLTTVVGRLSIDVLRARTAKAEILYDTPPHEPVVSEDDPADQALQAESLGLALLVVLGALGPDERLSFVLHDLFAVPFAEIGPIIGKSADAAKMAASRARRKVHGAARPTSGLNQQREVVDAFLAAARDGDFEGLLAVLDPDLTWEVTSVRGVTVTRGRAELAHAAGRGGALGFTARRVLVDGQPGILAWGPAGQPVGLMACTIENGRMTRVVSLTDRAQLRRIDLQSAG